LNHRILLLAQLGGSLEQLLQRAPTCRHCHRLGRLSAWLEPLVLQLAPHAEVELELVQNTELELGLELKPEQ
jgi:hypothetical protein